MVDRHSAQVATNALHLSSLLTWSEAFFSIRVSHRWRGSMLNHHLQSGWS